MPLLDHFHPPLSERRHWDSFHTMWTACIAESLNTRWLPEGYYADVQTHNAQVEINVATYEGPMLAGSAKTDDGGTATLAAAVWSPPHPLISSPVVYPRTFEVQVFSKELGTLLVGAVEVASEGNKDRPSERQAFVAKCASYVTQGVSLVVVDVVTNRHFNLHNELMQLMQAKEETLLQNGSTIYTVAYRPTIRDEREEMDMWPHVLSLGEMLPTMPLRLTGDLFVPIELETTYMQACRRLRLL